VKRIILLSIFGLIAFNTYSQNPTSQVGISFMHNLSTFRYVDSDDNIIDLDFVSKSGYGIMFKHKINRLLTAGTSLYYDNKGASDIIDNQKLNWSLSYVGINADLSASYPITASLLVGGGAGLYYARLITAEQYIAAQYYNLKSDDLITSYDFGFNLYGQILYRYAEFGSVFLRLNQSMGLNQLEKGNSSEQKMFNRTFGIQLGLLFVYP
jgi:hypothetical protein